MEETELSESSRSKSATNAIGILVGWIALGKIMDLWRGSLDDFQLAGIKCLCLGASRAGDSECLTWIIRHMLA
jgi:hypothetical protein